MSAQMTMHIVEIKNLVEAKRQLDAIDCDPIGVKIMQPKIVFKVIKIEHIRSKAANLLKQTFLGKGGDVAVSRHCASLGMEYTDAVIAATLKQYRQALPQLKLQPWGLAKVADRIEEILRSAAGLPCRSYQWKDRTLTIDGQRSLVMGILNITPDSFSDGGKYSQLNLAVERVEQMQAEGADIIDIGAESTRPYAGAEKVSAAEELERLLPILEKIMPHCRVPVSIDTYKAEVAEAALRSGAHIINDIWGLQLDPLMAATVAKYDVPIVVMHNQQEISYAQGVLRTIEGFLKRSIEIGIEKGIKPENIIIDPGIGFAKEFSHNMEIMAGLEQLQSLDCPVLLGTSRKKFIGQVLDLPVSERVEGTIATAALGKVKGVQIHRVHDVKAVKRTLKMMDAMMRSEENDENFN